MEAKKFRLFMGCLGNGITVCNAAVMEHGDYKYIAHISPGGNIRWYDPEDYVPPNEYRKISAEAMKLQQECLEQFNKLSDIQKYEVMCDFLPWEVLKPVFANKEVNIQEKINMLMEEFLKSI